MLAVVPVRNRRRRQVPSPPSAAWPSGAPSGMSYCLGQVGTSSQFEHPKYAYKKKTKKVRPDDHNKERRKVLDAGCGVVSFRMSNAAGRPARTEPNRRQCCMASTEIPASTDTVNVTQVGKYDIRSIAGQTTQSRQQSIPGHSNQNLRAATHAYGSGCTVDTRAHPFSSILPSLPPFFFYFTSSLTVL